MVAMRRLRGGRLLCLCLILSTILVPLIPYNQKEAKAFLPVVGVVLIVKAAIASGLIFAALEGMSYAAISFIKGWGDPFAGDWNIYDQVGSAISGFLYGVAVFLVPMFGPAVLVEVFGFFDVPGIEGALGEHIGAVLESCFPGMNTPLHYTYDNIMAAIQIKQPRSRIYSCQYLNTSAMLLVEYRMLQAVTRYGQILRVRRYKPLE